MELMIVKVRTKPAEDASTRTDPLKGESWPRKSNASPTIHAYVILFSPMEFDFCSRV